MHNAATSVTRRSAWASVAGRIVRIVLATVVLSGFLPFLSETVGFPFLPSPEYSSAAAPFAWWLAAIAAGFMTYVLVFGGGFVRVAKSRGRKQLAWWQKVFFGIVCPPLAGLLAYLSVDASVPMLAALANGSHVEISYTVKDPRARPSRGCRQKITLDEKPYFGLARVCVSSEGFRAQLRPGSELIASGWGTGFGLFSNSVRITREEAGQPGEDIMPDSPLRLSIK